MTTTDRSCEWVREAAPEFVLGTLDGEERADLVEHLAGCAGCREEVGALNSAVNDLALLAPELAPSEGFEAGVLAAMAAERPQKRLRLIEGVADRDLRWTRSRRVGSIVAVAAVVVLGLGIAGIRLFGHSSASGPASAPMISADGQRIGESTVLHGTPDVVTVTVSYPFPGTDYSLEGVGDGGTVVHIGSMHLRDGVWRWSGKLKADAAGVHVLRIVTPSGRVVCQGSLPQ